jgi:CBS domain-containing protein
MQRVAGDLMVPIERYPHLPASASLREAVAAIRRGMTEAEGSGFRRVLVLDERGGLAGILTIPALLKALEPKSLKTGPAPVAQGYAAIADPEAGFALELYWERVLDGAAVPDLERTAGALVQPARATVTPDVRLARALGLMLAHETPMLPVVALGRVVGALRLVDVFDRVAAVLLEERP